MEEIKKVVVEKFPERRSNCLIEKELDSLSSIQVEKKIEEMKGQPIDEKVDFLLMTIKVLFYKIENLQNRTEGVGGGMKC